MKEIWIKKVKSKKGGNNYIVEIREKFLFTGEQMKRLAKGEIKGMKLLELTEQKKKEAIFPKPEVIKAYEEEQF